MKKIILSLVAVSLTIGLILHYAHGITEEERKANREKFAKMIEEDVKNHDLKIQLEPQLDQLKAKKESLEYMTNFCFQHIERPNPIQDLIDKGFLGSEYKNITCKDIKMTYDIIQANITELENKIK
jgi:hypothetical protein